MISQLWRLRRGCEGARHIARQQDGIPISVLQDNSAPSVLFLVRSVSSQQLRTVHKGFQRAFGGEGEKEAGSGRVEYRGESSAQQAWNFQISTQQAHTGRNPQVVVSQPTSRLLSVLQARVQGEARQSLWSFLLVSRCVVVDGRSVRWAVRRWRGSLDRSTTRPSVQP